MGHQPYIYICDFEKQHSPVDATSNTILIDWQSEKYCLASDLKSILDSTGLSRGKRNGEEIEIEEGPLSKESGSPK